MSLLITASWPQQYCSDFHKFWGFCSDVVQDSVLLWYDTASRHNQMLTFPGNLVTIFKGHNVSLDILTLGNKATTWPQYLRVWLPIGTASYPRLLLCTSLFRVTLELDMQASCRSHVYLQSYITCFLFERLWYFISSHLGHGSVFIQSEPS